MSCVKLLKFRVGRCQQGLWGHSEVENRVKFTFFEH
jgi:hypothetical protein